ncbi:MAG TPA: PEP-CTERM sorting domain-containing protein [Phycisphaerae bacterium]|nr:PEP-CTERM sorting domain-containing protein [Phycisphaerae bacterium]
MTLAHRIIRTLAVVAAVSLCASGPLQAQTTATWTGAGGTANYSDANNWDIGVVPLNDPNTTYNVVISVSGTVNFDVSGTGHQVTQLSLAAATTLTVDPGRDLQVLDAATVSGTIQTDAGTFNGSAAASSFAGNQPKLFVTGGGSISFGGTTYTATGITSGNLLLAQGTSSSLDLSSVQIIDNSLNASYSPVRYIQALDSGTLDLSALATVKGGLSDDVLEFKQDGGTLNIANLQSIDAGNVRFNFDSSTFALNSLTSVIGGMEFVLLANADIEANSLEQWDASSDQVQLRSLAVPVNGSLTANELKNLKWVDVSIGDGGTLTAPKLQSLVGCSLTYGATQTLTTGTLSDITGTRILLSGGQTLAPPVSSYDTGDRFTGNVVMLEATGPNTVLDLSTVGTVNSAYNYTYDRTRTIQALDGGTIDLSGMTTLRGGTYDDVLKLRQAGGTLDISGLQSIAVGNVRFDWDGNLSLPNLAAIQGGVEFILPAARTIDLPSLAAVDASGAEVQVRSFHVPENGKLTANNLVDLKWIDVTIGNNGTFEANSLTNLIGCSLTYGATQTLTTGTLSDITGTRILLSGGVTLAPPVTTYDTGDRYTSNHVMLEATGPNTVLDLSTVGTLNSAYNYSYDRTRTIQALDGGTIDLSGMTTVRGGTYDDLLELRQAGGTLDIGGLQSIAVGNIRFSWDGNLSLPNLAGIIGGVEFVVPAGSCIDLPSLVTVDASGSDVTVRSFHAPENGKLTANSLTDLKYVDVTIGNGGTFQATSLTNLIGCSLTYGAGQTLTTGTVADLTGTRVLLSGGRTLAPPVTTYDTGGRHTGDVVMLEAREPNTVLDLSTVGTVNSAYNFSYARTRTIQAVDGGVIDLSGATTVRGATGDDLLRFRAASNGLIDLSGLQSITSGIVAFVIEAEGAIKVGDFTVTGDLTIDIQDVSSTFEVNGSLLLDAAATMHVASGGGFNVSENFSFATTTEADFVVDEGILLMNGAGTYGSPQFFEIGGTNNGLPGPNELVTGNFAIGQLIIGTDTQATVVSLLEVIDNGNRASSEALYLNGLGGPDGLLLRGPGQGSTLLLNDLDVYAWVDGNWLHLNTLFTGGVTQIDFGALTDNPSDTGWVVIPEPASLSLLAVGAVAVLVRRRRRR